jgi:hypothetical protein
VLRGLLSRDGGARRVEVVSSDNFLLPRAGHEGFVGIKTGSDDAAGSQVLWEIAKWMPKGYYEWHGHRRDLLAQAEGLGCAGFGVPLRPKEAEAEP